MKEEIKFSMEELSAMAGAVSKVRKDKANPIEKRENYINLSAASLLLKNGVDPVTRYGTRLSKAFGDFTGANAYLANLVTWDRNDLLTGARAKQFWDAVFEYAPAFMSQITMITDADEKTYPIDIFAAIPENLISSLRVGSQPTNAQLKDIFGIVGKELFARHIELQYNLKTQEIVNRLYDPGFDNFLFGKLGKMWTDDLLRLFTNGTSEDYSSIAFASITRQDMYKLNYGWEYLLQNVNGSWTNSNQVAIVMGAFGDIVTPNKVDISATGNVSKQTYSLATAVEGFTVVSDAATAITGTYLATTTSGANGYSQNAVLIDFGTYSYGYVHLHYKISTSDSGRVQVIDSAGTVLSDSGILTANSDTELTLYFNTDSRRYMNLRFVGIGSGDVISIKTVTVYKVITTIDGWDMQDIMDKLIENLPEQYRDNPAYKFIMSSADVKTYADSRSTGHREFNESQINQNTETRERYLSTGETPGYKGYDILKNPFKHSVSKSKSYGGVAMYGSIILMDPKDLFGMVVGEVEKSQEYKARMTSGGSGIEFTQQTFADAQIGLGEKIAVAFRGAKVDTPVIKDTEAIKSTPITTAMSAGDIYVYCYQKDVYIVIASDANSYAELATYDLAVAGVAAASAAWELTPGVAHTLTAGSYKIAAFKDGVLLRSDLTAELVVS